MTDMQATPMANTTESPVTMPLFIEDGWTIRETIKPEPGLHPGLTFQYRPMTWIERRKLAREQEAEKDPYKQDLIRAKQVASRIIDWGQGEVNDLRLLQLAPALFPKIEGVIFGVAAGDSTTVIEAERKN